MTVGDEPEEGLTRIDGLASREGGRQRQPGAPLQGANGARCSCPTAKSCQRAGVRLPGVAEARSKWLPEGSILEHKLQHVMHGMHACFT